MKFILLFTLIIFSQAIDALGGNTFNDNFDRSKRILIQDIYNKLPQKTFYCEATFSGYRIIDKNGFSSDLYQANGRDSVLEWEHVVPVEHFGRFFDVWRDGHDECVDPRGQPFKGRACAIKVSKTFRLMSADMYNLYPAIGAVNGMRSNYKFAEGVVPVKDTGDCDFKVSDDRKVEPKDSLKGIIARTALYMDNAYKNYRLSSSDKQLFNAWNKLYPVTKFECKRTKLIELKQHNSNRFVKTPCIRAGIW